MHCQEVFTVTFDIKGPVKKVGSVVLMGSLCAASIFSVQTFARDVYVNVDDSTIHSVTLDSNVDSILGSVGVTVSDRDVVEKVDDPDGSLKVNVRRAFDVTILNGTKKCTVKVIEGTVSDALKSLGIEVGENDIVSLPLSTPLSKDLNISIVQRVKVILCANGEEKEILMPKSYTVQDVLNHMRVSLAEDDTVSEDVSSKVYDGMKIEVGNIKFEEIVRTETLEREVVVNTSSAMNEGETKVLEEGRDGQHELKIRQKIQNGEVVDEEILSDTIISEPVAKVMVKGTKKVISAPVSEPAKVAVSSNSSERKEVSKVIYGSATAYTASAGARTSTGARPVEGVTVAVNPKLIPYGSRILVESTDGSFRRELTAQDTGGALRKGSAVVDIFMNSNSSCKQFGRKNVKVSIIK